MPWWLGDDENEDEDEDEETTDPDEIDNTGCQHANMKTDGMAIWCEDCDLSDLA